MYAEHEGENFQVLGDFTPQKFGELVEKTYFEYRPGDYIKRVYPAYAMLVEARRGCDFVIRQINGEQLATGQSLRFESKWR